ncbi:tyrosine-type recombinase/integrase [Rhodococcus sp. NPDC058505]|uniref:tyrosine-type recombinase/integrase n=1 Tax=unclassified Rhodococcus (in: high G+C Gram-positive bacteria) TaxID=192944 RepID=UPI003657EF44
MPESLHDWFEEFLVYRSTAKPSPNTLRAYRQDFRTVADSLATGRGVPPERLTPAVIDKAAMRVAFADYADSRQPASIRRCWSTWNMLCDFLFAADVIVANPMSSVLRPRAPKTVPKAFHADAVERLVTTLQAPDEGTRAWPERDLALILTGLLTGLRSAELIAIDLGDLRDAADRGKVIHVHGKGNKQRVVTVEPVVVDVLGDYLDSRATRFPGTARRRADVGPWERFAATDPMFVGRDGTRITRGTLQYRVERAYRRAGINGDRAKGALVHQLRHTFATAMADQNVSVYTLMRMLGHESMTTTQRYTSGAGTEVRGAAALNPAYDLVSRRAGRGGPGA